MLNKKKNKKQEEKSPKKLTVILKKSGGRDASGKISVRHKGGRAKRKYRIIDFGKNSKDTNVTIKSINYDPNRSANIALVEKEDHSFGYIIAPEGIKEGDTISVGAKTPIASGNRMKLLNIPLGTEIYAIEVIPAGGAKLARSSGAHATVLAQEHNWTQVKMPSGEVRRINNQCYASIGSVSNPEHGLKKYYKAGQRRWIGVRPTVRGKAMYPAAHPHGGGEGGSPIGLKYPKTPWGKPARGGKTRKNKKYSDKLIIKRRK
jgi:large subunit ribosomal protein L2